MWHILVFKEETWNVQFLVDLLLFALWDAGKLLFLSEVQSNISVILMTQTHIHTHTHMVCIIKDMYVVSSA